MPALLLIAAKLEWGRRWIGGRGSVNPAAWSKALAFLQEGGGWVSVFVILSSGKIILIKGFVVLT